MVTIINTLERFLENGDIYLIKKLLIDLKEEQKNKEIKKSKPATIFKKVLKEVPENRPALQGLLISDSPAFPDCVAVCNGFYAMFTNKTDSAMNQLPTAEDQNFAPKLFKGIILPYTDHPQIRLTRSEVKEMYIQAQQQVQANKLLSKEKKTEQPLLLDNLTKAVNPKYLINALELVGEENFHSLNIYNGKWNEPLWIMTEDNLTGATILPVSHHKYNPNKD